MGGNSKVRISSLNNDKRIDSLADAVADIFDGATVLIGGFGEAGSPRNSGGAILRVVPQQNRDCPHRLLSEGEGWGLSQALRLEIYARNLLHISSLRDMGLFFAFISQEKYYNSTELSITHKRAL